MSAGAHAAPLPPQFAALPAACLREVAALLDCTADRRAFACVCRAWRTSAGFARGAYICSWLPPPREERSKEPKPTALQRFRVGRWLFPALRSLDLVELRSSFKLAELLRKLTPAAFPLLADLGVSTVLGESWPHGDCLSDLPITGRLKRLRLYALHPDGSLPGIARAFTALTELSLSGAVDAAATEVPQAAGVACLTAISSLQALVLPALHQEEREQLSWLTSLTRLHFEAIGEGAVGASLLPLAPRLRDLRVALHHRREMFLVLHPRVDYAALAQLSSLEVLELSNIAAYSYERMPEVDWSDEPPPAERGAALLAALPALQRLALRCAFCRMPGPPPEGRALELADGRRFAGSVERVPVQRPGHRRPAEWYEAWWQADVQAALASCLGPDCSSLRLLREQVHEMSGWSLIRQSVCKTYDVLATWERSE
eukprot:scaffold2.g7259.t1